jgi:hypothetical protein
VRAGGTDQKPRSEQLEKIAPMQFEAVAQVFNCVVLV